MRASCSKPLCLELRHPTLDEADWGALVRREARLRAILQELGSGILWHGAQSEILMANKTALELLATTEAELLGRRVSDGSWEMLTAEGEPLPCEQHPVLRAIAARQPIRNVVLNVQRQQGERAWLLVNAVPQFDEQNALQWVVCSFNDIAAQRQAEAAL